MSQHSSDGNGNGGYPVSGQYLDMKTCQQLCGENFDESKIHCNGYSMATFHCYLRLPPWLSFPNLFLPLNSSSHSLLFLSLYIFFLELFQIFSMKVFPKDVLQQLLHRPTRNNFIDCKEQLRLLIEQKSCAPLFVIPPLIPTTPSFLISQSSKVRAAWHDSGTYNHYVGVENWPRCGGANGLDQLHP